MITLNDIYKTKSSIHSREDFSELITILSNNNIIVNNNHGRTILISCSKDKINEYMDNAINNWIGDIDCPPYYLYNILPINDDKFIIQI